MNKIICDVCGTSYPETASQCPICGCAKPEDAQAVSGDLPGAEGAAGAYTYVKGGRFSKSNVRKRTQSTAARKERREEESATVKQSSQSNKPLIIAAVLLVLAIIAMLCYIYFAYFAPQKPNNDPPKPNQTTTSAAATTTAEPTQTQAATTTAPQQIKCTELKLSENSIQLDAVGNAWLINVTPTPADTTDAITYSTSDPNVATVTAEGRVTAVGAGSAVITVYCGDVTATCNVTCNIAEPTTEPTTAPTTAPTKDQLKLNRSDITFTVEGESWPLYRGNISLTEITWSSDDETIATFEKGIVTAVGAGTTKVHAEYDGTKVSCIIRCNLPTQPADGTTEPTQPNQGATEPTTGETTEPAVKISHVDVSIAVGEPFRLRLTDAEGKNIEVTWTASTAGICSINGNVITGTALGKTIVSCTYEGATYSCIVRVRN